MNRYRLINRANNTQRKQIIASFEKCFQYIYSTNDFSITEPYLCKALPIQ